MAKEAVFTVKLEASLRDAFAAAAAAEDRPASQVVRERMRSYVQRARQDQERQDQEYDAFLREKVAIARQSIGDGGGRSGKEVEASFAQRRAGTTGRA